MRHVIKTSAPHLEAISVKEVLKDMFGHFRLRIIGLGLRHESVDDAHAEVDDLFQEVLFQFLMQKEPFKV
jgi:hypothetical protein